MMQRSTWADLLLHGLLPQADLLLQVPDADLLLLLHPLMLPLMPLQLLHDCLHLILGSGGFIAVPLQRQPSR